MNTRPSYISTELYHHGIKGQSWGVRNGPPYPLSSSQKTSKEKRNESGNSRSKKDDRQGDSIDLAIDAVGVGIYLTYAAYKLGAFDPVINAGRNAVESLRGLNVNKNGMKKLSQPEEISDTIKNVNPYQGEAKGMSNCVPCSIAATLRQEGYDVEARGSTTGMSAEKVYKECFKGTDMSKVDDGGKYFGSKEDASNMLLERYGDNAKGVCAVQWASDAGLPEGYRIGHIFNWEISNGNVQFFDSQVGGDDSFVESYFSRIDTNGYTYLGRTDNCEVDTKALSKYIRNKK